MCNKILPIMPFLSDQFPWYFLTKMLQQFNVSPCKKEVPPTPTLKHTSSLEPTKVSFLIQFSPFPSSSSPLNTLHPYSSLRHTYKLFPSNSNAVHCNLYFSLSRCYMWKIQVFWNVTLHHWVSSSPHPEEVLVPPSSFGQAVQCSAAILPNIRTTCPPAMPRPRWYTASITLLLSNSQLTCCMYCHFPRTWTLHFERNF